jgi:hypothetical protein
VPENKVRFAPNVPVELMRCDYLIEKGQELGYKPSRSPASMAVDLIAQHNAECAALEPKS